MSWKGWHTDPNGNIAVFPVTAPKTLHNPQGFDPGFCELQKSGFSWIGAALSKTTVLGRYSGVQSANSFRLVEAR